jgi:hypothetical protein
VARRIRHLGAYPLVEDDSARASPTTLLDVSGGLGIAGLSADVARLNALDEEARDIRHFYPSRLPGAGSAGVEDLHFHPVGPRQLRVALPCAS